MTNAQDSKLVRCNAVTIDITPSSEVPLGCPQGGDGEWGVADNIEINFLALWLGSAAPTVLVSVDSLYVGRSLEQMIVSALQGVPRGNIFMGATHTHAAPMTDDSKPALGTIDTEHFSHIQAKLKSVSPVLLDGNRAEPVNVYASKGSASHSVNRRQPHREHPGSPVVAKFAPYLRGVKDELITSLLVEDLTGKTLAVIWNYACHPVAFPKPNTVSAHFPGGVRSKIRQAYGQGAVVLYFQGFSGNTRPNFLVSKTELRRKLWHLSRFHPVPPPIWRPSEQGLYDEWVGSLTQKVLNVLRRKQKLSVQSVKIARFEKSGEDFVSPNTFPVTFQSISIGKRFAIVGVSAEPVAEYAQYLRKRVKRRWLMCVGCLDTPFGYAPVQSMISEGGYESDRFLSIFGFDTLNPSIEQSMNEGFAEVLQSGVE